MKNRKLIELKRNIEEEYPDLEHSENVCIQFPCWKYEVNLLYSPNPNPEILDETFIKLIKNGIDTRAGLAKILGIDGNEFIFRHLHHLVSRGFISHLEGGTYKLTDQEYSFYNGSHEKKEIIKWQGYDFLWDCASEVISRSFSKLGENPKEHSSVELLKRLQRPSESEVEEKLSSYFNAHPGNKHRAFYNLYPIGSSQKRFKSNRARWEQEYLVLFYVLKGRHSPDAIRHIEICDSDKFERCPDLTKSIESNKEWNKQLRDLYVKKTKTTAPRSQQV